MFNKSKKQNKTVTIQKFRPSFRTVDGHFHEGHEYNWAIAERLLCSVPDYIMHDVKSDGYLKDKNDIMYILANIVSIVWEKIDEQVVEDKFRDYHVFVTQEEVDEV